MHHKEENNVTQDECMKSIDEMSTLEIIKTINDEDKIIAFSIEKEIAAISLVVDAIYEHLSYGGRLIYLGAGTSGRLGVLDASECPPTFGVDDSLVQGVIAGGDRALRYAIEDVEDDEERGKDDLKALDLNVNDVVLGISASGSTPYVSSGLKWAKNIGALTISMSCRKDCEISKISDYFIEVDVKEEVIQESSRMKAGTAQKMMLNMISTAVMIKKGKVYKNFMIDVQPTNQKLKKRALDIVVECTDLSRQKAKELLELTQYDVKLAVLMKMTGESQIECLNRLKECRNNVGFLIKKYGE